VPPQALPYIILLGFFFGSSLVASRFSVDQFHPTTFVSLRLLLASLGHVSIYIFSRKQSWPAGRQLWRQAAVLGIFGTAIPMTSVVSSLQYQSSGLTAVLITTNPAITLLMAHFFLADEPLSRRKGVGVILALGGALLLALLGESGLPDVSRANPLGYILVMVAMISASGAAIFARRYMRNLKTVEVASVRIWVAALAVTPFSLLSDGFDLSQVTGQGYGILLYAALVGTFSGMMLEFYNIKRFGATSSAITAYVIPVVATLGGVLLLDETVTPVMFLGMALVIAGIALLNQGMRAMGGDGSTVVP
jgi:drug/metabolite transporter (DMT)-like permease